MTTPASTFAAFDADGYERLMGRWSTRLAQSFLDFSGSAPGERVLDLGCGTGHLAVALKARAPDCRITGVDLAAPYIEHAQRRPDAHGIEFRVANACALDLPDASFDRVLSLLVLHFVPKTTEAIAEMRRVARPGATVAAAVWDARGGFVANRIFFDTASALDPKAGERRAKNYTRPLTRPGEMAAAWHAAGFEDVVATSLAIRMEFASFEDWWTPYLGKDGPGAEYVGTLDATGRARLEDALRAAFLDGEPDGPRSYAALAWAVRGRAPSR